MTRKAEVKEPQVSVKTVLTVCLTVVGVATVVYIVLQTRVAMTVTIGAVLLAVALNHAVQALERLGVRRSLAIAAAMLMLLLVFAGIGVVVIPMALTQGKALIEQVPQLIAKAKDTYLYETLDARFHIEEQLRVLGVGDGNLQGALQPAFRVIGGAVSVFIAFIAVFFLTIFMLAFGPRVIRAWLSETTALHRERYERVLGKIYTSIGGYLAGLVLVASVNACLTTLFLAINQVPFFLPLGITSGMMSFVPYLGPAVMAVCTSTISLATGGPWHAVATAIYFILYGQLEGQVLSPIVYRRTVKLNPLIALLAALFFLELAGILGALVAVPAAAAGQILLREFLLMRRERLAPSSSTAPSAASGGPPKSPSESGGATPISTARQFPHSPRS